jgi:hypothetical protein
MIKRVSFFIAVAMFFSLAARADMNRNGAKYVDGSAGILKKNTDGLTHSDGEKEFVFESKKGILNIP